MRMIAVAFALIATPCASAQQSASTWNMVLDIPGRGEVQELAIAANGDIVVGGFVDRDKESVQANGVDGWLARYSPDGRLIWQQRIGGDYRDEVDGLAIAPDGSIYVAGPRDVQLRQSFQDTTSYVSRYSAEGVLMWSTVIDDADGSQVWLTSLDLLEDGSVLVAGSTRKELGSSDAYAARFSASGERLWQQWPPAYPAGANPQAPGASMSIRSATGEIKIQEHGQLGRATPDAVELIATQADPRGPLPARCIVIDLAKGDRTSKACGPMNDFAMHVTPASFPFAASRIGDIGAGDAMVRKYDDAGNILWEFAPGIDDGDGFNAAAPTPDGGAVVAGYRLHGKVVGRHNWDGVLVRLDRDGKQLWRREFDAGNRDELANVAVLADGSIIAAGYTTPEGASIWKPWVMRLNPDGLME